jgi:hypothetical protein
MCLYQNNKGVATSKINICNISNIENQFSQHQGHDDNSSVENGKKSAATYVSCCLERLNLNMKMQNPKNTLATCM